MTIAVVTDSSTCLPAEVAERNLITVVALRVDIDGMQWRDGELESHDFYNRLRLSGRANTAAPATGEFLSAFRDARESGAEGALCLTLPAEYSATFAAAIQAREIATAECASFPVAVADTRCLALAHGFCVLAAARAARTGAGLEDTLEAAKAVTRRVHLVGVLDTTRYLARGGRVPWVAHWAASLLRIKPVIAASDGKVRAVGRARTLARGVDAMLRYAEARVVPDSPLHAGVMHADSAEEACELVQAIRKRFDPVELLQAEVSEAMGVHTGPGFLALAFYSGDRAT